MGWRDRLQPASFRGVAFFVDADDASFGRRTQIHEYPQRDKASADDLGRAAREFSISAFLVGDDFMSARDKLIDAIELGGTGVLIHPFYGTRTVVVSEKVRVSHRKENGGYCEFQLSFTEAGDPAFPQAKDRSQTMASRAADGLSAASLGGFIKKFDVNGYPQFVSDAALGNVNTAVTVTQNGMRLAQPGYVQGLFTPASILSTPELVGAGVTGVFANSTTLFDTADKLKSDREKSKFYAGHANAALNLQSQLPHKSGRDTANTATRRQMIDNENAVNSLVRQQALSNAVGVTALMPIIAQDDALALRKRIGDAIDAELLTADDDVIDALMELRSQSYRDLTDRSRGTARMLTVTPRLPVPAAVMAYDLYEDTTRMDEIITRNRIANPAFVSGSVQVLSR